MNVRRFSLLMVCAALWVETARANSILLPVSVGGGTDNFTGEFLINWAAPDPNSLGQQINGTWEGGRWEFHWGVYNFFYGPEEPVWTCTLRTYWNNGWIPGGLNSSINFFTWGDVYTQPWDFDRNIQYRRPPLIAHDFSGKDLQYWLDVDADLLNFATTPARSGNARVSFNVTRVWAAPEGGAGAAFAIVVAGLLVLARRFRQSASA